MDEWPNELLLNIFSYIDWRGRLQLETVSKRWNNILGDKSLRYIGNIDFDTLVMDQSKLSGAIQSLVGRKHKVVDAITAGVITSGETLMFAMSIVASTQPDKLIRLQICTTFETLNGLSPLLNMLMNLEALDLSRDVVYPVDNVVPVVDLTQLVKLKELRGCNAQLRSCRAPNLRKLQYERVTLATRSDSYDFVQMIVSASQSIEILELYFVDVQRWMTKSKKQTVDCTLPKLQQMVFKGFRGLVGLTLDLIESRCLRHVDLRRSRCRIANLDLSVHNVEYFSVSMASHYLGYIAEMFVASAIVHPVRLCLVQTLSIHGVSCEQLTALLSCISSFYTYSFRKFMVTPVEYGQELTDSSRLVTLIERSPNLDEIRLGENEYCIDKQCLIDLIIATMPIVNEVDLYLKFYNISGGSECDFIDELYGALCLLDRSRVQRRVLVQFDWLSELSSHTVNLNKMIEDNFNIVISNNLSDTTA